MMTARLRGIQPANIHPEEESYDYSAAHTCAGDGVRFAATGSFA